MPFFPGKTAHELKLYLSRLSLKDLGDLNKRYTTHFESLENRIKLANTQFEALEMAISKQNMDLDAHSSQEAIAVVEEKERKFRLAACLEDSSSNNFAVKGYLSCSPLEYHQRCVREIEETVKELTEKIPSYEDRLTNLLLEKHACEQELKLVKNRMNALETELEHKENVMPQRQLVN